MAAVQLLNNTSSELSATGAVVALLIRLGLPASSVNETCACSRIPASASVGV